MRDSLIAEAHKLVRLHVDGVAWSSTDIAMAAVCLRALLLELNPAHVLADGGHESEWPTELNNISETELRRRDREADARWRVKESQ